MPDPEAHWENIYATKDHRSVSWYAPHVATSLELIRGLALPSSARILDVGGGASTLVDDLLGLGFANPTVLDLSASALAIAKARLGADADKVRWIKGDVLEADLGPEAFDVWHDRAVLHFLTEPAQRERYRDRIAGSLAPSGYVVISVFADDGPMKCSGLEVRRSGEGDLEALLGPGFSTIRTWRTLHVTPSGNEQRFVHLVSRKSAG